MMDKSRMETWVWVLVYAGLLMVCVAVFVLRAGGDNLGWGLLTVGALVAAAGAVLVVVRARMDTPPAAKKGPRP